MAVKHTNVITHHTKKKIEDSHVSKVCSVVVVFFFVIVVITIAAAVVVVVGGGAVRKKIGVYSFI